MSRKVDVDDLISYARMAEIIGYENSDNPRQLLRSWNHRGHINTIREDIPYFTWSTTRVVILNRLELPKGKWANVKPQKSRTRPKIETWE